ncbi:MAG TPA: endo alpha-1,4 polygalactosaminidase [Solirubrobacteraceae bacterium]|nr:endo alpha-1,4 polygalactosaminidase [Solirubrobacteraceae bacterium]
MARPRNRTVLLFTAALGALALALPAAAAAWWQPPARPTFYWQLQGKLKTTVPAEVFDVDGFETSAAQVAALHAAGKHVVCYIDVGTAENFRPDYSEFPASVLGKSNGWPGERWLDIRQTEVIEPIMAARFQMCAEKGFDAVEPDNIEAFSNESGFPITASEQLAYNLWVAETVHGLGMAVLQKNDAEQALEMQPSFDGVLTEQCNQYHECGDFAPYLQAGKPVINAEYKLKTKKFCAADEAAGIVGARFNLALNGKRFQPCW